MHAYHSHQVSNPPPPSDYGSADSDNSEIEIEEAPFDVGNTSVEEDTWEEEGALDNEEIQAKIDSTQKAEAPLQEAHCSKRSPSRSPMEIRAGRRRIAYFDLESL